MCETLWKGNWYDMMTLATSLYSECSSNKEIKFSLQDATHENIPIMMVGNKADLRQEEQGQKCVPINYGEKLAMVRSKCTSLVKNGLRNFNLKIM